MAEFIDLDNCSETDDLPGKRFNLVRLFALSIALLYLGVIAGMIFYMIDTPNREASKSRISYLDMLVEKSSGKPFQSELIKKIKEASVDDNFTNREFEKILSYYKKENKE